VAKPKVPKWVQAIGTEGATSKMGGYPTKGLTTTRAPKGEVSTSKDFPKIMSKMKVQFPKGMPRIKRSDMRIRNEQLKSKLKLKQKAIEKQKKVPGYVQTKASKKVTDKFITRETKVSLNAPFKTVGEQAKVINQIKSNIQVRQLNRTLKGTKKDTNYKTPRKNVVDLIIGDRLGKRGAGDLTKPYSKLKKTRNILKEPDIKEYAGDVKSYVKQRNAYGWKQAQKEMEKPVPSGYGSKKNPNKKERELEKRFQQHKQRMKKKPKEPKK